MQKQRGKLCRQEEKNKQDTTRQGCIISKTYVTFKIGSEQKILQYLMSFDRPASLKEISCVTKSPNFEDIIKDLVSQSLITEYKSEKESCYVISYEGRLKSTLRGCIYHREECP